jgi:hypothetical protein
MKAPAFETNKVAPEPYAIAERIADNIATHMGQVRLQLNGAIQPRTPPVGSQLVCCVSEITNVTSVDQAHEHMCMRAQARAPQSADTWMHTTGEADGRAVK